MTDKSAVCENDICSKCGQCSCSACMSILVVEYDRLKQIESESTNLKNFFKYIYHSKIKLLRSLEK